MTTQGQNWLNARAQQKYPLDDNATGVSDDGTSFKTDIIVDVNLRWPEAAGQYAFVGGITVTANIVTVVILGADSPVATTNFTPIASVTIPQPVDRYKYYALEAMYPGTGGFIAFEDTDEPYAARFTTPAQGLLLPKIASPYAALPVPTMRKYKRADSLTGLVTLAAGTDIEIVKEETSIEGEETSAIVIRLVNPTSVRNVLSDYIGPCGVRPESQNCSRLGIETINGVSPDCNGNITIDFRGFVAGPYDSCGSEYAGVTLDQSIGIGDVCTTQDNRVTEGDDYCDSASSSSSESLSSASLESISSESVGPVTPPSESASASSEACEGLPFIDCFNGDTIHASWDLIVGGYALVVSDAPETEICPLPACIDYVNSISLSSSVSLASGCSAGESRALRLTNKSRKNIMLWDDCGVAATLDTQVLVWCQFKNSGPRQNAGVVLNYHLVAPFTQPRYEYFVVQLNRDSNKIELLRYNGTILIIQNSVSPGVPFSLTDWYEISATCTDAGGGNTQISVVVNSVTNAAWPQVSFTVLTSQWDAADGAHGVYTNRAVSDFEFWRVQDA